MDLDNITSDKTTVTRARSGDGVDGGIELNAARVLEEAHPARGAGGTPKNGRAVDNQAIDFGRFVNAGSSDGNGRSDATVSGSQATFSDRAKELSLEAWNSFEHSFKQPVLALAQISDHTTGTTFSKNSWLSKPAPKEAEFDSADFWAQQTGNTLGSLPWYSLLHKAIGTGFQKAVGTSAFESMTTSQLHKYAIAESMLTGFTYGALLHPSHHKDNASLSQFALDRFLTGSTTGATFGISALTSAKITDMIGREPNSIQKISTSFFSSAASGAFDAEVQALRNHGRLANEREFVRGVYTYAVIGTGMTTIHELFPIMKTHTLKQRDNSYSADEKIARNALSGLSSTVRQAVFNGQSEASVMRIGGLAEQSSPLRPLETGSAIGPRIAKAGGAATAESPFALPSLQLTSKQSLTGAPSLVFNRLNQAGLRPRVVETPNGQEIRVPLTDLYRGAHPLLKSTIDAANQGYRMRWEADQAETR